MQYNLYAKLTTYNFFAKRWERHAALWSFYVICSYLMNKWMFPATRFLPLLILNGFLITVFYRMVKVFKLLDDAEKRKKGIIMLCFSLLVWPLMAYLLIRYVLPFFGMALEKEGFAFILMHFLQQVVVGFYRFSGYALTYVYYRKRLVELQAKNKALAESLKKQEEIVALEKLRRKVAEERNEYFHKLLTAQIYPHFLRNSFSLLMARAVVLKDKLMEETVGRLSAILGYALECTKTDKPLVFLSRELQYLKDMIALIRLQKGDDAVLCWQQNGVIRGELIPPFSLLTLLENVLKFGKISTHYPVRMDARLEDAKFVFKCTNHKKTSYMDSQGGLGLKNLSQRLEATLPNPSELHIDESDDNFTVSLTINYADYGNSVMHDY